jgi:hypothetical protein
MATVTLPTSPAPSALDVAYEKSTQVVSSPYTFSQKTYRYPGKRVMLNYEFAPMTATQFGSWFNALDDLEGGINTFNVNLSLIGGTNWSARTSVPFRLVDGMTSYSKTTAGHYILRFTAVEAI